MVADIVDAARISRNLTVNPGLPSANNLGSIIESRPNVRAEA